MTILFIRHGETALNVARTVQPADTPLSDRGHAQAEDVARRLAGMRLAGILSSDLPRARQTADRIAAACGLPVATSALWQERNFGAWRGQRYDALGFDPLTRAEAPPDGESAEAFSARVAAAFADLVARRAGMAGALAVVTHGLVIRELLQRQLHLPEGTAVQRAIGNTSVTIVAERPPHSVQLLDCLVHLEPAHQHDRQSLSGG